jgi:hypothetical protein
LVVIVRNSRSTTSFTSVALAVSVGLLLLPACSGNDASKAPNSPPAATSSPAPSAAVKTVGFDETYRTDDGVVVQITEIDETKLGPLATTEDSDAKEGDPFVVLATKTTNKTKTAVEFVPEAVVKFGPEKTVAAQVFVEELDGLVLEPNQAYDFNFGFLIPREYYDQVIMDLRVTIDPHRAVSFAGPITPT